MTGDGRLAFISYAHKDDQRGEVTKFREGLVEAVRMYLGQDEIEVFQDRNSIGWGEAWRRRIVEELDSVKFFIPILTPRFFNSRECREELSLFIERERELGRDDLVLPVYFVDCPSLDESADDELAATVAGRQLVDWRELRPQLPRRSKRLRLELEKLAKDIVRALERLEAGTRTPSVEIATGADGASEAVPDAGPLKQTDAPEQAEIAAPVAHQGSLAAGTGEFFDAVLTEGRLYRVYVAPDDPSSDFDLHVYDPNGVLVAQDVDARSEAYCEVLPAQTSHFRVVVTVARGVSTYTLVVAPADAAAEASPGLVAESTSLAEPGVYASSLSFGNSQYLDVMLQAGTAYRVYVHPDDPSVDFDLRVYDQNGNLVAEDADPASDADCIVIPLWTGPFRVQVEAVHGSSNYRLFVVAAEAA